jgi:acetylornithine deacetylase/succinyl-diaminopimelate desuccinylase family protein
VPESTLPQSIIDEVTRAAEESQDELIGFLQELIRVPSENPKLGDVDPEGESNLQDVVQRELEAIGCTIDRWDALPGRPNVVGVLKGSGDGRSLAVNGHIDVVPAGDPAAWPHPPFSGEIADGMVWGRGAVDMKGGVAAMIHAAKLLKRAGYQLHGDLIIESVVDEEAGGTGTRATVERGYKPDFAIVTEPTGLTMMPVAGGLEWVRVSVEGRSAHAGRRYQDIHAGGGGTGVNALEKGIKIITAIQELEREWGVRKTHPLLPKGITTIAPTVMVAGSGGSTNGRPNSTSAVATIPDYCAMEFDLKFLPTERSEDIRAEFEDYIHRIAQTDPWLREHPPKVEWEIADLMFPPTDTSPDHPGMQTLAECVRFVGEDPRIEGCIGVADIAWLAEGGIPCTLCGPGRTGSAHTSNEHIEIDQMVKGTTALALMMLAWCGYDAPEFSTN